MIECDVKKMLSIFRPKGRVEPTAFVTVGTVEETQVPKELVPLDREEIDNILADYWQNRLRALRDIRDELRRSTTQS
ncbi:MAG: hypothetical protein M1142_01780 [Patescibacteria group bacterium]|nr:hypothetical protein [Patescibacteria group bacterium]